MGWSVQDRSSAGFVADMSAARVLQNVPYPVLRISPTADHPSGRAILVAGEGKIEIADAVEKLSGNLVDASGNALKRGDLDMMVLDPSSNIKLVPNTAKPKLSDPITLGRYRISGEICDGKCLAGAMRREPGLRTRPAPISASQGPAARCLRPTRP